MPDFKYQGTNRSGSSVSGVMTANSKADLQNLLRRQQITPTKMSEKGKEFNMPTFGGGVNAKELAIFTRQFSVMIDAGLPLVQCLEILASQQENKFFQKVLINTRSMVESGSTLSTAMRSSPKVFDGLYVNMVEAGETGGILVVPIFATLFAGLGVTLPLPTKIVIAMSNFVGSYFGLLIVAGIIGGIFGLKVWYGTPGGKFVLDTIILKLPVLGLLMRKIAVARFTRTLGTLISSGVPILEGLDITAKTSGNAVVERALQKVRKALEEGKSLTEPLKDSNVFPGMVTQMIAVGEQTGAMDAMLQKIADFYEEEVDAAVKDLLTAMEPVMIVFLGVVVGGVVISMYLPLFTLIGKLSEH
jgi:type IV pilus assembly protein PilC